jgi:hypothetical protein
MLVSASANAEFISVGSEVFGDEFTGSPDSTTLDATKWTSAVAGAGASVLLNTNYAPSNVEIYTGSGTSRQAHISTVSALDFSASPNDWWAQVVFKFPVQGGAWAAPNSPLSSARQYNILSGQDAISASAQGNSQGIDVRAVRYGNGLWALAWYGIDDTSFRIADILDDNGGAGYAFNDTQNYAVSMHRKSDGTVDIYLDKTAGDGSSSTLIANKPPILGLNPVGLTSGDWSASVAGYLLVDRVNVGAGIPERNPLVMVGLAVAGLVPAVLRQKHR